MMHKEIDTESMLLCHFLDTIVYRAEKAIKIVPDHYPLFQLGNGVRSPLEILAHITHVLTCAHSVFVHDESLTPPTVEIWEEEIKRFYDIVDKLRFSLSQGLPNRDRIALKLIQGPLSDALAHVGQLSMLKRMANDPIPAENFFAAEIKPANRINNEFRKT